MPAAKEQVLICNRETKNTSIGESDQVVIIRLSPGFIQMLEKSFSLVTDNKLAYVVQPLRGEEYAGLLHHLPTTYMPSQINCELCVFKQDMWFQCTMDSTWGKDSFKTEKINLKQLTPVGLPPAAEKNFSLTISKGTIHPYKNRLKALLDVDRAFEIISETLFRMDTSVPNDHLALVDRIWFGGDAEGPFLKAKKALTKIESDIEAWEKRIETEKNQICCLALGINIGDILAMQLNGRMTRIQLERASLHVANNNILFHIGGRKFRKNGLLGKRGEYFVLHVENDTARF